MRRIERNEGVIALASNPSHRAFRQAQDKRSRDVLV